MSKKFQSKSMCFDITTKELEGIMLFFEKYKNKGFESSMNIAKSLAFDMNIELILPTKRCVFRKKNNLMRIIMMKKYNQLRSPLESIISWLL